MTQLSLPGMSVERVVNVASVPQRSPFRYPGGKTWLVPTIRQWLSSLADRPGEFIEPFAGGAIVGLSVAFEGLAGHVTLIERDEQVAAVWQTIINEDEGEWLAEAIIQFDLNAANVQAILTHEPGNTREIALQTIIRNRVNRGGILAPGAGQIKTGEAGKGIRSRWYPETLKRRILDIKAARDSMTFIAGDGMSALRDFAERNDAAFFIDPPYTASGKKPGRRLYTYSEIDHETLFMLATTLSGSFLMTYDDHPYIRALAAQHGFEIRRVPMKNTHHARLNELLIGRNLDWIA
jgi:DNA adenine methylase